jgi:hypothetical protein
MKRRKESSVQGLSLMSVLDTLFLKED